MLPVFNNLTGKEINEGSLLNCVMVIGLIGIVAFTGLVAGSYPAFYLSSFQPIDIMRKKMRSGPQGRILRSCLVILQFTISVFLIISTLIVITQLRFMKDQKLGFKKETDNISATLSFIEKTWKSFEKDRSFEYFFVDENFDALYH